MQKLLIIQETIPHYRVPLFEGLKEKGYDLCLAYSDEKLIGNNFSFKTHFLKKKKIGPFYVYARSILSFCSEFDVVIALGNIRWLSLLKLLLIPQKTFKLIFWGIGVSASYTTMFDSNQKYDQIRYFLAKKADGMIFYSSYPLEKYLKAGISERKLFVANNTVHSRTISFLRKEDRKEYLFVGSLYKENGIFSLLEAYLILSKKYPKNKVPVLRIVGDGCEYLNISNWIRENSLEQNVYLEGSCFDETLLSQYYSNSFVCVSPNQAGLTVLKSFSYGVPFVTNVNAITGGERLNIEQNKTGFLFNSFDELVNILELGVLEPEKLIELGNNAFKFYWGKRQMSHMVTEMDYAVKSVFKS